MLTQVRLISALANAHPHSILSPGWCLLVNRQGKWDTIGTKVNGHLGACSCSLEEVKHRLRKEQDCDSNAMGNTDLIWQNDFGT